MAPAVLHAFRGGGTESCTDDRHGGGPVKAERSPEGLRRDAPHRRPIAGKPVAVADHDRGTGLLLKAEVEQGGPKRSFVLWDMYPELAGVLPARLVKQMQNNVDAGGDHRSEDEIAALVRRQCKTDTVACSIHCNGRAVRLLPPCDDEVVSMDTDRLGVELDDEIKVVVSGCPDLDAAKRR